MAPITSPPTTYMRTSRPKLSLTACSARSSAPDAQQTSEPQADTSSQVDISELPDGQCYRQTPYLNPIGISYPDGQCIWNGKVYSFSNAPAKLGVTDANGNSEALELPDAEYIYGVCENGDTLAVLAGICYNFCVYFAAEPQLMGQNPALYENVSRLVQFWL